MYRLLSITLLLMLCASALSGSVRSQTDPPGKAPISHDIKIRLYPDRHRLEAEDRITVPESLGRSFSFVLHEGLDPMSPTPHVSVVRESATPGEVPLVTYRVSLPLGLRTLVLTFRGSIHHPVEPNEKETARGSRSTPGLISKEGVFLSGGSHWYPRFGEDMLSFDLEVTLPRNWDAVSQGERTAHEIRDNLRRVRWHCAKPQEDISLVAGPFAEFSRTAGQVQTMVFLREPDAALAAALAVNYLKATAQYLDLYDKLIGAYPYKKCALVENYWETGYGMPSFALMGSKVIRFPFIISSSYPHEILHNWWGNSVYPDPKTGNWCEGLTAYMADHLLREQRGTATEYRRDTLQRYTDYVSKENDFPLSEFRSRHSAATQAIGYGKALMFFHMVRMNVGDDAFREAMQDFFRQNVFRFASYDDIRRSFETVSGKDLSLEFAQWVTRPGAPRLKVSNPAMTKHGDRYVATAVLEQPQAEDVYNLHIPVAVTMEGQDHAYQTRVVMTEKRQEFRFDVPYVPLRIDVDPEFDVFRRLERGEVPPALTQVFGAKRLTIVLPQASPPGLNEAFAGLAQSWQSSGPERVEVINDDRLEALPSDGAVVILGWENRLAKEVRQRLSQQCVTVTKDHVTVGARTIPRPGLSVVFAVKNPLNPDMVVTWIATDVVEAVSGLARKVPHYHGYSYLVFQGNEPSNVLKGQWPVLESPMTLFVPQPDGSIVRTTRGKLEKRTPLAVLPPAAPR